MPASRPNVFVFLGSILRHNGPSQPILKAFQMLLRFAVVFIVGQYEDIHPPGKVRDYTQNPFPSVHGTHCSKGDKQRIILNTLFNF